MTSGGPRPAIDVSSAPARGRDVHTVEVDGEAVLLDEAANRLHRLNRTATLVWACLDGDARIGDLAREIADELDLSYDAVLAETLSVIRSLDAEGLLDRVAPPGTGRP